MYNLHYFLKQILKNTYIYMYVYVYFLEFVLENSEDYTLIFDIYLFNILGSFQINMKFLSLNIS